MKRLLSTGFPRRNVLFAYSRVGFSNKSIYKSRYFRSEVNDNLSIYSFRSFFDDDGILVTSEETVQSWFQENNTPPEVAFKWLLQHYRLAGSDETFYNVLKSIREFRVSPDLSLYSLIAYVACGKKNFNIAEHYIMKLIDNKILPDEPTISIFMNLCFELDKLTEAVKIVITTAPLRGKISDAREIKLLINTLLTHKNYIAIQNVVCGIQNMLPLGELQLDDILVQTAQKKPNRALKLLERLSTTDFKPHSSTITLIMKEFTKRNDIYNLLKTSRIMTDFALDLDALQLSILVHGSMLAQNVKIMEKFINNFQEKDLSASMSFTTIASALGLYMDQSEYYKGVNFLLGQGRLGNVYPPIVDNALEWLLKNEQLTLAIHLLEEFSTSVFQLPSFEARSTEIFNKIHESGNGQLIPHIINQIATKSSYSRSRLASLVEIPQSTESPIKIPDETPLKEIYYAMQMEQNLSNPPDYPAIEEIKKKMDEEGIKMSSATSEFYLQSLLLQGKLPSIVAFVKQQNMEDFLSIPNNNSLSLLISKSISVFSIEQVLSLLDKFITCYGYSPTDNSIQEVFRFAMESKSFDIAHNVLQLAGNSQNILFLYEKLVTACCRDNQNERALELNREYFRICKKQGITPSSKMLENLISFNLESNVNLTLPQISQEAPESVILSYISYYTSRKDYTKVKELIEMSRKSVPLGAIFSAIADNFGNNESSDIISDIYKDFIETGMDLAATFPYLDHPFADKIGEDIRNRVKSQPTKNLRHNFTMAMKTGNLELTLMCLNRMNTTGKKIESTELDTLLHILREHMTLTEVLNTFASVKQEPEHLVNKNTLQDYVVQNRDEVELWLLSFTSNIGNALANAILSLYVSNMNHWDKNILPKLNHEQTSSLIPFFVKAFCSEDSRDKLLPFINRYKNLIEPEHISNVSLNLVELFTLLHNWKTRKDKQTKLLIGSAYVTCFTLLNNKTTLSPRHLLQLHHMGILRHCLTNVMFSPKFTFDEKTFLLGLIVDYYFNRKGAIPHFLVAENLQNTFKRLVDTDVPLTKEFIRLLLAHEPSYSNQISKYVPKACLSTDPTTSPIQLPKQKTLVTKPSQRKFLNYRRKMRTNGIFPVIQPNRN